MSIQEAYKKLLFQLYELYDNREAANIADMVIEYVTGQQKTDRIIHKTISLDFHQQEQLENLTQQLLQHKPVQYVLQEVWFGGMKFFVNQSVLIPRPETEELIDWITQEIKNNKIVVKTILDIGTGSGCIPISLQKKNQSLNITALDISKDALKVAEKNAANLSADIIFICSNFLDENNWGKLPVVDLIVSNPPYIKQSESISMQKLVTDFEPHLALFVSDENPLIFYHKIALFGKNHLSKNGKIFVEINESLGKDVAAVFQKENYEIELRKDMYGKDRMLKANFINN